VETIKETVHFAFANYDLYQYAEIRANLIKLYARHKRT